MKKIKRLFVVVGLLCLTGCLQKEGNISVVGIDWLGNEVSGKLDKEDFKDDLVRILGEVNTAATQSLESTPMNSNWEVETLTVGVGLNVNFGVLHFVTLETSGRLRMAFSQNTDPLIPGHR